MLREPIVSVDFAAYGDATAVVMVVVVRSGGCGFP
jgi:hypothetical protein